MKVVSWNIARRRKAWLELFEMARRDEVDVALLQEAGKGPPNGLERPEGFGFKHVARKLDGRLWPKRPALDRWPAVVKLSDRVQVEWIEQLPAGGAPESESEMEVSGVGTLAAARVTPAYGAAEDSFFAVSMYARWLNTHPATGKKWIYSDASAHQILTDLSAFAVANDPADDRILAAGELNMFYGAVGYRLSLPERERTFWKRCKALGLKFLGPQWPAATRRSKDHPDVPKDSRNVPTYYGPTETPAVAVCQLDYVFASRGFHKRMHVHAMNGEEEWGPSDHCRLMIDVGKS